MALSILSLIVLSLTGSSMITANPLSSGLSSDDTKHAFSKTFLPAKYESVPGFFVQDDPATNTSFDVFLPSNNFGLKDNSTGHWKKFKEAVAKLNREAPEDVTYKVFFIARHGQGFHNVEESYVGTPAWNCYWSLVNGNGTATWGPDALLTQVGKDQAQRANVGWKAQIAQGVPLPQILYSSPLSRAASTLKITWSDILINKGVRPLIKEGLRESIGLHTCDKRRTKTYLRETYPQFEIEKGFTEDDELWGPKYEETDTQMASAWNAYRIGKVMNYIFQHDPRVYISITAHGGVISGALKVFNHQPFSQAPGGMVPVVVKATKGTPTLGKYPEPSATAPTCTANPNPSDIPTTRAMTRLGS